MRKVFVEPVVLPEPRFRDGLGIRYVRTDGSDDPVEVLRPLWELAAIRATIQNRVGRLTTFRQARFVPVRRTDVPPDDASTIEVVSDHVAGNRLSEILDVAKTGDVALGTSAALHIVRELLGAIAVLHESRGVTHGAIGPERILITPRGRMVVADYVLGSAIERLEYSRSRLWREFRIPMPPGTGLARFDEIADVIQIGVTALALLVGRPLEMNDYPDRLSILVESIGTAASHHGRQPLPAALMTWLKRTLPHEQSGRFATVREARVALETVLSKQRLAVAGAEALKSLAEACQPRLLAAAAVAAPTPKTRRIRAGVGVDAGASAEQASDGSQDTGLPESGTDLVPAITLLTVPSVVATIDGKSSSRSGEVAPAYLVEADPPVGWRVPEPVPVEEPLVEGRALQGLPVGAAPLSDRDFVEEVLDLGELLVDEPAVTEADDEVVRADEPSGAASLILAEAGAAVPVPDGSDVEVVLDLVELREGEPLPVVAPPAGDRIEEPIETARVEEPIEFPLTESVEGPVAAGQALREETPTIERQPERRYLDDLLDVIEYCEQAPSSFETPIETARVEAPLEMARVEAPLEMARVEEPIEIPVEAPVVASPVLQDEPHTIEVYPDSSSIDDILALFEPRDEAPRPVEALLEAARAEESILTSRLAPAEPPVGWRVRAHHRADEPAIDARLFREYRRGEEGGGDAAAADLGSAVPPASIEPASIDAELPPDWLVAVEITHTDQRALDLPEGGVEGRAPQVTETRPPDDVRLPMAEAARAFDTVRPARVYARRGEPLPAQPPADTVEPVGAGEPVVPRVAPSIQRVRAAAARRRLTRLRTGIIQFAQASGRTCGAALASVGTTSMSMAKGVAGAWVALARAVLLVVSATGEAGAATLSALARGLRAGAQSLEAACVIGVTALGRVAAAIGRGGGEAAATVAAGSMRSFRAIGRGGRAIAAWTLTSSAGALRATRAAGVAILALTVRVVRAAALALLSAGTLVLAVSGRTARATARAVRATAILILRATTSAIRVAGSGGVVTLRVCARAIRAASHAAHDVGATAVAGTARALRVGAGAGRAGSARAFTALSGAARGTVRSSASIGAATGPVVMRAGGRTFRAGRAAGAAARVAGLRVGYFVGDLAERFLQPVLRPGYLLAALLVIAAVAGVPYAKAYWFSLVPRTGTLRVESARPGLMVRIDGVAHGTTPLSTALPVGRHRIEVDGGGRTPAQDVVVIAGQDTVVQWSGGATKGAGTLRLTSEPAGAQVWLDGVLHGTAPLTIDNVAEGSHTVVIREAGGSVRQTVRVRAGETVDATIPVRPGWLAVFAPVRLDIVEDGRVIGNTERGRILVKPGVHTLELVGEGIGYRDTRTVEVKSGDVAALTIELPPAMLEIVAPADAEILIDGQLIGKAPLAPVAVAAGTREVTMRHPTLGEERQMTTITYRTPNRVVFEPRN